AENIQRHPNTDHGSKLPCALSILFSVFNVS
ncbi:unnamed protein product, partial [Rotaria sp. Silwood1]